MGSGKRSRDEREERSLHRAIGQPSAGIYFVKKGIGLHSCEGKDMVRTVP